MRFPSSALVLPWLALVGCEGPQVGSVDRGGSAGVDGGGQGGGGAMNSGGQGGSIGGSAGTASGGQGGSGGTGGLGGGTGGLGGGTGGSAGSSGAGGCVSQCTTVLVQNNFFALSLARIGTTLYFANTSGLSSIATAGGKPANLASGNFGFAMGADQSHLYYTPPPTYDVWKISKTGSSPTKVGDGKGGAAQQIDVAGGFVYFNVYPSGLYRVPVVGGTVEKLNTGTFPSEDPSGFALSAGEIFWTNRSGKSVLKRSLGGGATSKLATGLLAPNAILHRGNQLIFADVNEIWSLPDKGGTLSSVAKGLPDFLAEDGNFVYWTSNTARRVARVPLGGGPTKVIAKKLKSPSRIVVDSANVYFIEDGGILRSKKDCCVQ